MSDTIGVIVVVVHVKTTSVSTVSAVSRTSSSISRLVVAFAIPAAAAFAAPTVSSFERGKAFFELS